MSCPFHSNGVEPQPVTHNPGVHALFIVLNISNEPEALQTIRDACGDFSSILKSLNVRDANKSLKCVMGFGSDAWDKLFGSPRPANLHPFIEMKGDKHLAPSTPGDILLHIRADSMDLCFEFARQMMDVWGEAVTKEDEVHAFRYFDGRSIVGFVDGTENPVGDEAFEAAIIGEEDPYFQGGSYVIVQKYLHDMKAWNALPVAEQEKVFGRTKFEDIEMDDDTKPINAHTAVTIVEDEEGNELDIVRANLPFGNPASGEFGTYFIGYARHVSTTEKMLERMFIGEPRGNYDRLLDFSTAITGTLFFVPSVQLLAELAEKTPDEEELTTTEPEIIADYEKSIEKNIDGSFKIGSLK